MEALEQHIIKYEETLNQMRIPSAQGLINTTAHNLTETTFKEVVGTVAANGTPLISKIEIPAGYVFVCYQLQYSCNEGRVIAVCTVATTKSLGDASQTERYAFGDGNIGLHAIQGEEHPVFKVDNSAGTATIDLYVYAPHTVNGLATNDAATSYFMGHIAGILYYGKVEQRGS